MYIDSGKDLKVDKIVAPTVNSTVPNGNKRTQVPVKKSTAFPKETRAMRATGAVMGDGAKHA
mgnify:CR=1 FL=1